MWMAMENTLKNAKNYNLLKTKSGSPVFTFSLPRGKGRISLCSLSVTPLQQTLQILIKQN